MFALVHCHSLCVVSRASEIEEAIRKGISDADPEARAGTRR